MKTPSRLLVVALLPLVTACAAPAPAPAPAPAQPAAAPAESSAESKAATAAKLAEQSKPAPTAAPAAKSKSAQKPWPKATIPSLEQTGGIQLGQPLPIGWRMAAIVVTNTTTEVKGFTVRVKTKTGAKDNELSGTVSDLRPGQTHVMGLNTYSLQNEVPDSMTLEVTGMQSAPTTPKAEASAKLKLGEPSFTPGTAKATVEVTNADEKEHAFSIKAGFMKGDELVGYAEKSVSTLKPGQSTTASLIAVSATPAYDRVIVSIAGVTR